MNNFRMNILNHIILFLDEYDMREFKNINHKIREYYFDLLGELSLLLYGKYMYDFNEIIVINPQYFILKNPLKEVINLDIDNKYVIKLKSCNFDNTYTINLIQKTKVLDYDYNIIIS